MQRTDESLVLRTARDIARAMRTEWDHGLMQELHTLLAEWRFADALIVAGELAARRRCGCQGSITDAAARFRLTDDWLGMRAGEIALGFGFKLGLPDDRPADEAARTRHARLGVATRTNEPKQSVRSGRR